MEGTTLRIQNGSRAHAESLHLLLADYKTDLVQQDGSWHIEVELGELAALLIKLFNTLGTWLAAEQVDSLFLHFDERQFTLLRPSSARLQDSNAFLLERVSQLETALNSRIAIEQAKGILARALNLTVDQAFDVLRQTARNRGAKLHHLAGRIAAAPAEAEAIVMGRLT
jgi:ANTAR domain-containing protein